MDDNARRFDLEERTFLFGKTVRAFVKRLPKTACNEGDVRQLARASGSVGANYIEANEATTQKDFAYRLKISRKECKESRFWLRMVDSLEDAALESERCQQLRSILSAIIKKAG